MSDALVSLLARVRAAADFDAAAGALLAAMFPVVEHCFADGALAGRVRVLRGMVHLRPDLGTQGLAVVEHQGESQAVAMLPSSTAWRWVQARGSPVAVDVVARLFATPAGVPIETGDEVVPGFESRAGLMQRDVTHLLALPLRAPRGTVCGMVAVELGCVGALGQHLTDWARCEPTLQLLADVVTPHLQVAPYPEETVQADAWLPVIGRSMASTVHLLRVFSRFEETVLIRGETGTGKTNLAAWCHRHSSRADGPFVPVNLLGLPDNLREAELFGWRKGAFTGAARDHQGCVARAEGGTLFIDEIGKLPLDAQTKLLRLLEERRYHVLGGRGDREADVRFIVGANTDLEAAVERGTFLRDLYFRINVLPVRIPNLAERADEIGDWAAFMARRTHHAHTGNKLVRVTPPARAALGRAPWPGNLRQLKSVVVRAYAFAGQGQFGVSTDEVVVTEEHVRQALSLELGTAVRPLLDTIATAATAFVDELARRSQSGAPPLRLDHCEAFCGAVLEAAVLRFGSARGAFEAMGLEARLKGGNHLRTLRREQERLEHLKELLEDA